MHHLHTAFDISGAIFSLAATIYYVLANPIAWPMSLVAIAINITLYFQIGLYADTSLELVYLVSVGYGWYAWLKGGQNHQPLPVTRITLKHAWVLTALVILGTILVAEILHHFTDSQVPYWDAATATLSLAGQWLTCRKIIETWMVWFVVDGLYAGLYAFKGIPVHCLLMVIYLGLAIAGYLHWRRLMPKFT